NRAIGSTPNCAARSADINTVAAAPSEVWDALPAVTMPFAWNAGFSFASASSDVSARGPSSVTNIDSIRDAVPFAFTALLATGTGTSSSTNLPAAIASSALRCEASANSSDCSRVTPCFFATRSAVSPIERYTPGQCSTSHGFNDGLLPLIGTYDIDSTPPATIASAAPAAMRPAACEIACSPDAQKRFTVIA